MKRDAWMRRATALVLAAGLAGMCTNASGQGWEENPPVMMQWFEVRWADMERRMPDWFAAGYGSVWLPPVSRGYLNPTDLDQNSKSAGYDVFDRFHLGKPGAETAYGTEASFDAVVEEFHRANGLVHIDIVLNHNAARQTGTTFMLNGGYPGFWMAPPSPMRNKLPTDDWGDFHAGVSGGYYQSEDPQGARYCLLRGDLVALIDIDHARSNLFIRQPVSAGNPQNIPAGTYFNRPDASNARFYTDQALGTTVVNNPGMWYAGPLNTGIFAPPCDVAARNEPPTPITLGRFNEVDPMAGDPVPETATGYLLRWVQWMLDVKKVDGLRVDAIKHMPSWFYDTYYDAVVFERRRTPDGRMVTPFSFGECVEGNDFTFDRYIRKPNGRTTGRNTAGDAFGNRDALDLGGAGALRDLISNQSWASWGNAQGAHLDNTDDGFNNGSIGVNHIFSHDNGSAGNGGSAPPNPSLRDQGWFAHAYLVMRTGQAKLYHNGRGVNRSSGFWPRQGLPLALGHDPVTNAANPVITDLVRLSNWLGRGEYTPRWTDDFVHIFERRTPMGGGAYTGNVLVGCNRSYAGLGITSYDQRTFNTSFPAGTRLIEMTGNAARADVDPSAQIPELIVVGAGGSVTIRVPRNQNLGGTDHHRGFVIYAPAIPDGTLSFTNVATSLAPDPASGPNAKPPFARRQSTIPVIRADSFEIQLTTVNGDPGAGSNVNADDNALFRIDAGFEDWNNNAGVDIPHTNAVVPGYENFVTQRSPLAGTSNTNGVYRQVIDATRLSEGMHYISVAAFRARGPGEAPLFREFRQAIYIDRALPQASLVGPLSLPLVSSERFTARAADRTVQKVHMVLNPPSVGDPLTLASDSNLATQTDRLEWQRTLNGLVPGTNTVLVIAFEEGGRGAYQFASVEVGCVADFNNSGGVPDDADVAAFFAAWNEGLPIADINQSGGVPDDADVVMFFELWNAGC